MHIFHLYNQGGVDIRVEIEDPNGKIQRPTVEDFTAKQGCYKVFFMSAKLGKHKATVLINGDSINPDGYRFNVISHGAGRQSVTYSKSCIHFHCIFLNNFNQQFE